MVRRLTIITMAMLLAAMSGCGGGDQQQATPQPAADSPAADAGAADADSAAANAPELIEDGFEQRYADAGFHVYWPSGCGQIQERSTSGVTRRAAREFVYTCDRAGAPGSGVSIRCLRQAHDSDGFAVQPPFVVALIERQLREAGVQMQRQRPLEAEGIEGVEVQAAEPEGAGEVWIRGFLVGADVYLLQAWNRSGGLFDDPDVRDFFASFRVGE